MLTKLNWCDTIIICVGLLSTLLNAYRGLIKELFSLVGWIGGAWLAWRYYQPLAHQLQAWGLQNSLLAQLLAGLLLFCALVILCHCLALLMRPYTSRGWLHWVDQLLGAFFGGLRGLLIVVLAVMLLANANLLEPAWCQQSLFIPYLQRLGSQLQQLFPEVYQRLAQ